MFTGIVEETGKILRFVEGKEAWHLTVTANAVLDGLSIGDSVAVNGCCLTVTAFDASSVTFDLLGETLRLTSFDELAQRCEKREAAGAEGDVVNFQTMGGQPSVNLERSLRFDGKVGGHFVSGHIDALGKVELFEARGKDYYMRVAPPEEFLRYVIYKGSIAIDGVSLTVAEVDETSLAVWLIPHTLEVTNFHERQPGDHVNLEFDLLGKYVEKLLPGNREEN